MTGTIPVVVCIDVEPDRRRVSREAPEPWTGYDHTQERVEALRERFTEATGRPARFSWFLRFDDQIALTYGRTSIVDRHHAHLDEVRARGDELGVHVHPQRWLDDEGAWLSDYGSARLTSGCLRTSVQTFTEALGEPCRLLRYGDGWMDGPTLALAEQLGIVLDLTLEPRAAGPVVVPEGGGATGEHLDLRRLPREPYAPDAADFRRPAPAGSPTRTIDVFPLSAVLVRSRRPWRRPRIPLSPWREWTSRNPLPAMIDQALASSSRPHLAVAIRSGDWRPGSIHAARHEAFFDALASHPTVRRFELCPPTEAVARLRY